MRRRSFLLSLILLSALSRAATGAGAVRYPLVTTGARLAFPLDHGAHPEFRTEWWYVTGALDAPQQDMGFQLTFFRSRPGRAEGLKSPIAASQILFAHAAITLPGARLLHANRAARANLGAGFSTSDCDIHIGAWQMLRRGEGRGESFRLKVQDPSFALDLTLTPSQPLLLQGESGYSQKGPSPDFASYYVSWPQLRVEGALVLDGKRQAAKGLAWFDHEWSSELLGAGSVGWDWVGINLADGGALMAFRMRNARGESVYAHATLRDKVGHIQQFGTGDVSFTPIRTWSSPRSGANYPVQIEIRFGRHTIRTLPVLDDQEISTRRPALINYWEGLTNVSGTLSGRGYLEMTGYADALNL